MAKISLDVPLTVNLTPELDIDQRFVNEQLSLYTNQIMKQAANEGAKVAKKELERVYKEIIRQYYLYKTKEYYRHGEKETGTGKGSNLFWSGKDMEIDKKSGWAVSISPNISADSMEGYVRIRKGGIPEEYSKEKVLDQILEGKRFNVGNFKIEGITMRGCKGVLSGTPEEIIETIRRQRVLRNIQQEVIKEKMEKVSVNECVSIILGNILKNRK